MTFSGQYETIYGFGTLDELHNFMPEILYDDVMFPNEMLAYFRHRISTLFPQYIRQKSLYTMYGYQQRHTTFSEWRRARSAPTTTSTTNAMPDIFATLNSVLGVGANIRVEIPGAPVTPPAQIRGRQIRLEVPPPPSGAGVGTNSTGQPLRNVETGLPPQIVRQQADIGFNANLLMPENPEALLNLLATGIFANTFDVPIILRDATGRHIYEDVEVTPTSAEIDAGSTIVNQDTIAEDFNCAICQEHTYADTNSSHQWRQLHCSHSFHKECIDSWLLHSVNCPACRADIRAPNRPTSYVSAARRGAAMPNERAV
jgi:hypothetical protein